MDCPNCGQPGTWTVNGARTEGDKVKRTRRCSYCRYEFGTVELSASALRVLTFQASMHRIVNGNGKND